MTRFRRRRPPEPAPAPAPRERFVGELVFPNEWLGGHTWFIGPEIVLQSTLLDAPCVAAGGVLDDGTNLLGLCYRGGQRLLRVSPDTDWAVEERFAGDGHSDQRVQHIWRVLIQSVINAHRATREEMRGER